MKSGHATVGHPIDVASGVVTSRAIDFTVPGRLPVSWERIYSTALLEDAPTGLGRGWTSPFFSSITRDGSTLLFRTPDGDLQVIDDAAGVIDAGGVLRDYGRFQEIRRAGTRLLVTRWDVETGRIEHLEYDWPNGRSVSPLARLTTVGGEVLELGHDAAGRVRSIRQAREGRVAEIEYDSRGRAVTVRLVTLDGGRDVMARYEYDVNDLLVAAYDAMGNVERYGYDADGRITAETNKRGGTFSFVYDKAKRCVRTTGPGRYDEQSLRFYDAVGWTEVTNSLGEVRRLQWNGDGQIISELSPRGARSAMEYDAHGRTTAITDPLGGQRKFTYDENGNRSGITNADGSSYTFSYNESHQLTGIVDPAGASWKFQYDTRHRLTERLEPGGHAWTFAWDASGNLFQVKSSAGGTWSYQHNATGQVDQATLWSGQVQYFTYDARGWLRAVRDQAGRQTEYHRDSLGRLLQLRRPDGSGAVYEYGPCGELTRCTTGAGSITTFEYGRACGRLLAVEYADGRRSTYEWTTVPDRLAAIVNPAGQRHVFEYDADGFLIADRFPNGRVIKYERNLKGEVHARTNGAGEVTSYARDPVGRVTRAWCSDGGAVSFSYGPTGRILEASNSDSTVEFERDVMGRRTREACDGIEITSAYDPVGNRIARESSLGAHEAFTHDPSGALTALQVANGDRVRFTRDVFGREVRREFTNGIALRQKFDFAHRLVEQDLAQTAATRDANAPSILMRRFEWDENDALSAVSDDRWGTTAYRYDSAGRVISRTNGSDPAETFTYDANGSITSSTRTFVLKSSARSSTADVHDGVRQIVAGDQIVRAGDSTYEYDGDGRLVRKVENASTREPRVWSFRWNAFGFLTNVTTPTGATWHYAYDAFGRRIRKQSADRDIRFVWDGNAVLHEVPQPGAPASTWTFFPSNYVPIVRVENGASRFAITDHLGTPREMIDKWGTVDWAAKWSVWGELERHTGSSGACDVRFQGQWFDAETGLHYNNARYYDPSLGTYISPDPIPLLGGLNAYAYVPNPLRWIDPLGLAPEYRPLDPQGRPTGAYADLTPADRNTGTPTSSSTKDPPGWVGGTHPDHQQRGHLIADSLGGSGTDARNIVTLTDGTNNPGMAKSEAKIRNHLDADPNARVTMEVTVHYDNNDPNSPPKAVSIYAIDEHGNVIVDERVENGKRQKQKCCT